MQQNTNYIPGGTGSSENRQVLRTTPVTLQMRIMPKNSGSEVEFTCLSQGGLIKATVPENQHVDSVDPEPGVGYGGFRECKDQHAKKTGFGKNIQSGTNGDGESVWIFCT
ncbi:MAG: hypothetical protein Q7U51_01735 [Methanoregula sp.]|nr:hypothetical protein [Methanoregula sp.]